MYKTDIEEIIDKTFKVIKQVYNNQREACPGNEQAGSRILFPKYSENRKSNERDRISEQELRFIFVEQLNKHADEKNIDLYYSVETPTMNPYVFKDKDNPKVDEDGISANIDLVIYTKKGTSRHLG